MAVAGTSKVSLDAYADIVTSWLEKIAENTARARDALEKRGGGGGGGGKPGEDQEQKSRWERATKELGDRFESAFARWQRTPVEKLIAQSFDSTMNRLGGVLAHSLSTSRGLANRGFSGTVEGARYDYAMEQLSRQFAAVMMPVMQAMTYGAEQIERRMRGLSGSGQNRLLGVGLGAYAGSYLGPLGMLAGGLAGSALMGGPDSNDSLRAGAAGAYAGFRVAGVVGAVAGGAAGTVAGAPEHRGGEGPFDYWRRMRMSGSSWLGATAATGGRAAGITVGAIDRDPGAIVRSLVPARRDAPHRDVTPYNPAMQEAGGFYFQAQQGVIRATAGAGAEEDGGPFKPLVDIGIKIIELLAKIAGVEIGPAPAPAPVGR